MRVLHVIPSVAQRYGGTSTAIVPMINSLYEQDTDVYLAATDADGAGRRVSLVDFSDIQNLHLFRRDFSETWKVSSAMWRWLKHHVRDFDLVHIHALWSFSSTIAARVCMQQNIPYILRPAGMLSEYSFHHKGWKKQLYWRVLEKKTIQNASSFHATSHGEEQDIKRVRADANIFVIPNGVEDEAFNYPVATDTEMLRTKMVNGSDAPVILFLSRLHPKKGIVDLLLPAFSRMTTGAHLLIVGGEDSHYPGHKAEVEKTIQKLDIADRVHLRDTVDGDDRWELFDLADLFVLPSHSENFGIVVAEAMARACSVVVTSDVQACPLVEQSDAGVIVSGDIDELARVMDQMVSDPDLCRVMGENGRRYAEENLRWEMIGRQIKSMYASVLS